MKTRPLIVLVVFLAAASGARAQEGPPATRDRAPVRAGRVDFWGDRARAAAKERETDASADGGSLWAEPIVGPDGRATVHVPPKAVMEFLDRPTRENAEKYVAWQSERMKRIRAAVEMLRALQQEHDAKTRPAPREEQSTARATGSRATGAIAALQGEIEYFTKPDCPWCARQDEVFERLRETSPALKVTAVAAGDPRWREYGVTATPTLVVRAVADGRRVMVRGFTSAADLARILESVSLKEVKRAEK